MGDTKTKLRGSTALAKIAAPDFDALAAKIADDLRRGTRGWDTRHPMLPIPNPNSWRGLGRKPVDQVLAKLRLLDFDVHVMQRLDFDAVGAFNNPTQREGA